MILYFLGSPPDAASVRGAGRRLVFGPEKEEAFLCCCYYSDGRADARLLRMDGKKRGTNIHVLIFTLFTIVT